MEQELLERIIRYLNNPDNYQWATSQTLIKKLDISGHTVLSLDKALAAYFKTSDDPRIRFSTLPSSVNLNVLWGSIERVGEREVIDIYNIKELLEILELKRPENKNMFLSYSFKDTKQVIQLAEKLTKYGIYPWVAELELLRGDHINNEVIKAINKLPYFGVFITKNSMQSTWTAKEIASALRTEKPIIGFLYTQHKELFDRIKHPEKGESPLLRKEIFQAIFSNHPGIKFLLYPDAEHPFCLWFKERGTLLNWDYLKSPEFRNLSR